MKYKHQKLEAFIKPPVEAVGTEPDPPNPRLSAVCETGGTTSVSSPRGFPRTSLAILAGAFLLVTTLACRQDDAALRQMIREEIQNELQAGIRTTSIIITDKDGLPGITLLVDSEDGPTMTFADTNGLERLVLNAGPIGSGFFLMDENGATRVMAAARERGPLLTLNSPRGEPVSGFEAGEYGSGIVMRGMGGQARAVVGVSGHIPSVKLYDAANNLIWQMPDVNENRGE